MPSRGNVDYKERVSMKGITGNELVNEVLKREAMSGSRG
jgi:hypothetical protein